MVILVLPDPNDRHVLAAAIKAKVERIITANLKDFPTDYIKQFNISIQHPDTFILDLLDKHPEGAFFAFEAQVRSLRNPPRRAVEVLETLRKCG